MARAGSVLVTVSRGAIARNLLQTAFLDRLLAAGAEVTLATPAHDDPDFRAAFGRPGVSFAPLAPHAWTRRDAILSGLQKGLVYNETRSLVDRYGIYGIEFKSGASLPRYLAKRAVFAPLSRVGALRGLARALDARLARPHAYDALFRERRPSVVLATNPFEDADLDVMKTAAAHGVPVAVFPKSWDNLSKMGFRVMPDLLLLWGEALVEDAARLQGIGRDRVRVVGVPQYDVFDEPGVVVSRSAFCGRIGADPARALVVLGSEGKISPHDGEVAAHLADAVAADAFGRPAQLFLRPYYALPGEEKKFAALAGRPHVIVDRWFRPRPSFRDSWDWSREHAAHFANLMTHADAVLCTASTLAMDAAYRDRPIVNVAYDGDATLPYGESVRRWYDTTHYRRLLSFGATAVARSREELVAAVADALAHPEARAGGRAALREAYCPRIPGGSGPAIADALLALARNAV